MSATTTIAMAIGSRTTATRRPSWMRRMPTLIGRMAIPTALTISTMPRTSIPMRRHLGRRRGGLVMVAAVLGLAVLGTAGAFAYRAMLGGSIMPSLPPIIKAGGGPNKIVPANTLDTARPIDPGGSRFGLEREAGFPRGAAGRYSGSCEVGPANRLDHSGHAVGPRSGVLLPPIPVWQIPRFLRRRRRWRRRPRRR